MPNLPDERNQRPIVRDDASGIERAKAYPEAKNPNLPPSPPPAPPEPTPLPLEPSPWSPNTKPPGPGGPIAPNPSEPTLPDPERDRRRDDIKAPEPRPRNPIDQSAKRTTVAGGDANASRLGRMPVL